MRTRRLLLPLALLAFQVACKHTSVSSSDVQPASHAAASQPAPQSPAYAAAAPVEPIAPTAGPQAQSNSPSSTKPKEDTKPMETAKPNDTTTASAATLYDFDARTLEGEPASLDRWRGKVVLVVNTASQCGYTPQYAGLEKLHEELAPRGFAVLGFPCDDFGGQEPGDAKQIRTFCTEKFQVTFPLHEKLHVKGAEQAPLYAWLGKSTGSLPNWNFCKYLIGKDGKPIRFWSSKTTPDAAELRTAIESALAAK